MASAKITYDPEMRQGEHGRRLYAYWKKVRNNTDSPVFAEYPEFYKWANSNGYTVGAKLFRCNSSKPYSPDNCFWVSRKLEERDEKQITRNPMWGKIWDDTVNRIRRHYGMEPIYSPEV